MNPTPKAEPMPEIDIADDDKLRFIQRVLESNSPQQDRDEAAAMVRGIRTRVRRAYATAAADVPELYLSTHTHGNRAGQTVVAELQTGRIVGVLVTSGSGTPGKGENNA